MYIPRKFDFYYFNGSNVRRFCVDDENVHVLIETGWTERYVGSYFPSNYRRKISYIAEPLPVKFITKIYEAIYKR